MLSILKRRGTSRETLKAKLAARAVAEQAVSHAREKVERLQAVIQVGDDASRKASAAARAAAEARQRWATDGCLANAREHQALAEDAAQAASVTQSAVADAAAVSKELARATDAVQSAQSALRGFESEIDSAVGSIIFEEESGVLEEYLQAADKIRTLRIQVMALHSVLDPWHLYRGDAVAPMRECARLVDAALERGRIENWDTEHARDEPMAAFKQFVARWRDRAARLRADPES